MVAAFGGSSIPPIPDRQRPRLRLRAGFQVPPARPGIVEQTSATESNDGERPEAIASSVTQEQNPDQRGQHRFDSEHQRRHRGHRCPLKRRSAKSNPSAINDNRVCGWIFHHFPDRVGDYKGCARQFPIPLKATPLTMANPIPTRRSGRRVTVPTDQRMATTG